MLCQKNHGEKRGKSHEKNIGPIWTMGCLKIFQAWNVWENEEHVVGLSKYVITYCPWFGIPKLVDTYRWWIDVNCWVHGDEKTKRRVRTNSLLGTTLYAFGFKCLVHGYAWPTPTNYYIDVDGFTVADGWKPTRRPWSKTHKYFEWLVGDLEHGFYFYTYWEQSSHLTFIFFRGVGQPPTRWYNPVGWVFLKNWVPQKHGQHDQYS